MGDLRERVASLEEKVKGLPAQVDELIRQTAYLEGFISNDVKIQPPSEPARLDPPDHDEGLSVSYYFKYRPGEYRFSFSDGEMVRCFLTGGGIAGYATELADIEEDNQRYAEHIRLIRQWYEEQTNP